MEKLILIIEDEEALVGALTTKLEQMGDVKVMLAKDGQEGLKIALSAQPDLILLDLLMPKMDGLMLLSKLREDSWGKTARVVVLTNLSVAGREAQARLMGVEDYIIKTNVSLSQMATMVKVKLDAK